MNKCSNCKKEIENARLIWHETMCKQTMKYCDHCQEAIEIEEFEEHIKENLYQSNNQNRNELKLDSKESFKQAKSLELIPCPYCNLPILLSEYEEHEQYCAEMKDECIYCNKEIRKKDKEEHEQKCLIALTERSPNLQKDDENFARLVFEREKKPLVFCKKQSDLVLTEEEEIAILYPQYKK